MHLKGVGAVKLSKALSGPCTSAKPRETKLFSGKKKAHKHYNPFFFVSTMLLGSHTTLNVPGMCIDIARVIVPGTKWVLSRTMYGQQPSFDFGNPWTCYRGHLKAQFGPKVGEQESQFEIPGDGPKGTKTESAERVKIDCVKSIM